MFCLYPLQCIMLTFERYILVMSMIFFLSLNYHLHINQQERSPAAAAKIWNSLHEDLRQASSLTMLISEMKTKAVHIWTEVFDSALFTLIMIDQWCHIIIIYFLDKTNNQSNSPKPEYLKSSPGFSSTMADCQFCFFLHKSPIIFS